MALTTATSKLARKRIGFIIQKPTHDAVADGRQDRTHGCDALLYLSVRSVVLRVSEWKRTV